MSTSRKPRHRSSGYSLVAEGLLVTLVVSAPLMFGGVPAWATLPFALLAGGALVAASMGAAREGRRMTLSPPALMLLGVAMVCALQLVPLPARLLSLVSPAAADLGETVLAPLGLSTTRPVSLEPSATWRELAKHLAYAFACVAAAHVGRSPSGRKRLVAAVAASGLFVALIGLGHLLIGSRDVLFGVMTLADPPPLVTPFWNPNHLAGYLLVASTLALTLALSTRDRSRALLWGVAYVVIGAAVMLSFSRGGIVFFALAQVLVAALVVRSRRMNEASGPPPASGVGRWGSGLAVLAAALCVVTVGAYVAFDRLHDELWGGSGPDLSKVALWGPFALGAGEFARAGMGRGAFELAFQRFQPKGTWQTFTHPENIVLQLFAELGFAPAIALIGLTLWLGWSVLRRSELSILEGGIFAALTGLVLQNLFDFGLEYLASAGAAIVLAGVLWRKEGLRLSPSRGAAVVAAGLMVLALVGAGLGRAGLHGLDERTQARVLLPGASIEELRSVARSVVDEHPAYHLPHLLVAYAEATRLEGNPAEALAHVNRALFIRPKDPGAHRVAARALLRLGRRQQAFLEYRLALETRGEVLDEAMHKARTEDELTRTIPCEVPWIEALSAKLWAVGRRSDAEAVLRWGLAEVGGRPESWRLWISRSTFAVARGGLAEAHAALESAERVSPGRPEIGLARAQLYWHEQRREQAIAEVSATAKRHPAHSEVGFQLAAYLIATDRLREASAAVTRLQPFIKSPIERARLFGVEGNIHERERRLQRAVAAYASAARLQPDHAGWHYMVARVLEQVGRYDEAARAVQAGIRLESEARRPTRDSEAWRDRLRASARELRATAEERLAKDELRYLESMSQQPAAQD